ncbi:MAG: hypothetical protein KBB83_03145 [Alphaproteobacteria bacterium]|nr:hypothetical protein [Alphaproteobacteria bacterium]
MKKILHILASYFFIISIASASNPIVDSGECGAESAVKKSKMQETIVRVRFKNDDGTSCRASLSSLPDVVTQYILSFVTDMANLKRISLVSHGFCNYVDARPYIKPRRGIQDQQLIELLTYKPRLSSINFSSLNQHIRSGFQALSAHRDTLQHITFDTCPYLDSNALSHINGDFPRMRSLVLNSVKLTNASIQTLLNRFPNLTSFTVSNIENITYQDLGDIVSGRPGLTTLSVENTTELYDQQGFSAFLEALQTIHTLWINERCLYDYHLKAIAYYCTQLNSLSIPQCQATDAGIKPIIENLTQLTELNLWWCTRVTGNSPRRGSEKLTSLNLQYTRTNDTGLRYLAKCFPNLTSLDVSATSITDACLPSITKLTSLVTLDLSATQISDLGLTQIVLDLKKLKKLKIAAGKNITQIGLDKLVRDNPLIDITGYIMPTGIEAPHRSDIFWTAH